MNRDEGQQVVRVLAAAFRADLRGLTPSEVLAWSNVYAAGLADLDFEEVRAGVERLVRSAKFLPRVAEIREAVLTVTRGQIKSGAEAWREVISVIGLPPWAEVAGVLVGPRGRRPTFADPITARLMPPGAWLELCASSSPVVERARFVDAYDALARQGRVEAQVSPGAAAPALPARAAAPQLGPPPGVPVTPKQLAAKGDDRPLGWSDGEAREADLVRSEKKGRAK